jgi:lysine-specific permease
MNALILTTIIGFASFLTSIYGSGTVYLWLLNASSVGGFIAWAGISLSHYRFRRAYLVQGRDLNELKFKAKLFPYGSIFAIVLCLVVLLGQNYSAFFNPTGVNWASVVISYAGIPAFIIVYISYKVKYKTKLVPLEECDFSRDIVQR